MERTKHDLGQQQQHMAVVLPGAQGKAAHGGRRVQHYHHHSRHTSFTTGFHGLQTVYLRYKKIIPLHT